MLLQKGTGLLELELQACQLFISSVEVFAKSELQVLLRVVADSVFVKENLQLLRGFSYVSKDTLSLSFLRYVVHLENSYAIS